VKKDFLKENELKRVLGDGPMKSASLFTLLQWLKERDEPL
jgi:hypothetical protein